MLDPRFEAAALSYAPDFFTGVRNPKWSNVEKTKIDCEVNFKHIQYEEWTPFTADPNDYMPYSKDIFDRAVAGEFGEVAELPLIIETSPLTEEQIAAIRRRQAAIIGNNTNAVPGVIL